MQENGKQEALPDAPQVWITPQELIQHGLDPREQYRVEVDAKEGDIEEGTAGLYLQGTRQRFRLWGINLMGIQPSMQVRFEVEGYPQGVILENLLASLPKRIENHRLAISQDPAIHGSGDALAAK